MEIPKVLMDKALNEIWGAMSTRTDYQKKIDEAVAELKEYEQLYAALKKKLSEKEFKTYKKFNGYKLRHLKNEVIRAKDDLKQFKADWFAVDDVKEFFKNYHSMIEKDSLVLTVRPQDRGKKRFECDNCGKQWYVKTKPKQCNKCKSKNIVQYYRL